MVTQLGSIEIFCFAGMLRLALMLGTGENSAPGCPSRKFEAAFGVAIDERRVEMNDVRARLAQRRRRRRRRRRFDAHPAQKFFKSISKKATRLVRAIRGFDQKSKAVFKKNL